MRVLREGGIVAYPTEAVFGLGCDPWSAASVQRLLELKHRDMELGLILIAANFEQLVPFVAAVSGEVLNRIQRSWPGPVTWICPARPEVPSWVRGRHAGVAVRVTAHPPAVALCRMWDGALISTSANLSGRPPARDHLAVRRVFGKALGAIAPGGTGGAAKPSAICDALSGRVLR